MKHKDILKKLNLIFELILKFKKARDNLYAWCEEQADRLTFDQDSVAPFQPEELKTSLSLVSGKFKVYLTLVLFF